MTTPLRGALRGAAVLSLSAAALLAAATPALAHVTAQPGTAEQGGYTVVNMRVPNESDTAGTIALQVSFPAEHPLSGVRTTPVAGWTAAVVKEPLATPIERNGRSITERVASVTWTAAAGTRIGPGEFLEFPISVGPLPTDTGALYLPAVQTYDDGEVVAWDQLPGPDGAEPERPAPVLTLTAAGSAGHGDSGAASAAGAALTDGSAAAAPDGADTTARWLGGGGLLLGALGLGLGAGAALRVRRARSES